jgi:hypothetical protein
MKLACDRPRLYRANVDGTSAQRPAGGLLWRLRYPLAGLLLAVLLALLAAGGTLTGSMPGPLARLWAGLTGPAGEPAVQRLLLLLPDEGTPDAAALQAWRDAADELGFPLDTATASQLMRDGSLARTSALILPDQLHRRMGDVLLQRLREQVRDGARLMLVHDAGTMDLDGQYLNDRARLSDLAGVDYAMYGELRTGMLRESTVAVPPAQVEALQIPPGKLLRSAGGPPHTSDLPPPAAGEALTLAGYVYGALRYTSFVTRGGYDGTRLMEAPDGSLVAGLRRSGAGRVLFVNLPLTQLKLRTDALPLHSLLRYFAQQVAGLPQLSAVPQGRGALVMNWHIDDRKALPAMARAAELGAFQQGPYSIHFTVGPDVDEAGDGKGMDLLHNPDAQAWVQRLAQAGHEVGSHGGWIHNWFGAQASKLEPAVATELIERNAAALTAITGRPMREYSAPVGNHPAWLTPWLRERGMRSYYFTGDTGMPPTRSYQDGAAPPREVWAFPVSSFGALASFEEVKAANTPEASVAAWLRDLDRFCADHRSVRLVYFHPFGLVMYPEALRQWLEDTRALIAQDRLAWMTMAQYADFANRRLQARWSLDDAGAAAQRLHAEHPVTLAGLTWLLPRERYLRPDVKRGEARVDTADNHWRVVAGEGRELELELRPKPEPQPQALQPPASTAPASPAALSAPAPAPAAVSAPPAAPTSPAT